MGEVRCLVGKISGKGRFEAGMVNSESNGW